MLVAGLVALVVALCFSRWTFFGQYLLWGDPLSFFLPLKQAYAAALAEGHLPLWNTGMGCGFPQLAESQTGALYPLNLLLAALVRPVVAFHLSLALHTVLACLLMYAYARTIQLGRSAALLSGLAFGCGGFFMAHHIHEWAPLTGAWLPLEVLLVERYLRHRRWGAVGWLGVVVGVHLTAGHFQLTFYSLVVVAMYTLVRAVQRGGRMGVRLGRVLLVGVACVSGFAFAAAQVLPTWEFKALSVRRAPGVGYIVWGSLPPHHLSGLLYPMLWAPQYWRGGYWMGTGVPGNETVAYVGLAALLLALWGLRHSRYRDLARLWGAVTLVGLILALGRFMPFYRLLVRVPGFGLFRVPARWLFLSSAGLAVLAGLGADALMRPESHEARRRMARFGNRFALVVTSVGVLLAVPLVLIVAAPQRVQAGLDFLAEHLPSQAERLRLIAQGLPTRWEYPPMAVAVPIVLVLGLVMVLRASLRRPRLLGPLLALHLAVDLVIHAVIWTGPSLPRSAFEAESAVAAILGREPDDARVVAVPNSLPVLLGRRRTSCYYGIPLQRGLLVDKWLERLASARSIDAGLLSLARLTSTRHVLRRQPADGAAIGPGVAVRDPWLHRVFGWPEVVYLYTVRDTLPRARLVQRFEVIADPRQALKRLCDPDFDVAAAVVLETQPPPLSVQGQAIGPGAARIVCDEVDRVEIRLADAPAGLAGSSSSGGLLVLADTFYPGWTARVDDTPVPILCANVRFRAVSVAPGSQRVVFTYHPRMFALGWRISVGTLAAWSLVWAAVLLVRSRRRSARA